MLALLRDAPTCLGDRLHKGRGRPSGRESGFEQDQLLLVDCLSHVHRVIDRRRWKGLRLKPSPGKGMTADQRYNWVQA